MTDSTIVAKLESYGWLPIGASRSAVAGNVVEDAAQAYAAHYGIPDRAALLEHLSNRFCGVPDQQAPFGAAAQGADCRWGHLPITVQSRMFSIGNLDATRVRDAFAWSLDRWAAVSGFRWRWQEGRSNIEPHAARIDGNAGTLAWSYLPCGGTDQNTVLVQRYDSADPLLVRSFEFFRAVVLHELGHALGLQHTNDQAAIMFPAARFDVLDLGGDDLPRIRRLYPGEGARPQPPTTPEPPAPPKGVERIGSFVGRLSGRPGRLTIDFEPL